MKTLKRLLLFGLLPAVVMCALVAGGAWYWLNAPVSMDSDTTEYVVEAGSSPRRIAKTLKAEGVHINEDAFVLLARLSGQDINIKAGAYQAVQGDSPFVLLDRMAKGEMLQTRITFIEGWSYSKLREALKQHPQVKQTLDNVSDQDLMQRLGAEYSAPEGMFYPDTYIFVPGTTDFEILSQAYEAQMQILQTEWELRQDNLPLKSPYEALILASIIEKETGHGEDRARVAGVFINRLKINMALQTDPTVIYGMGDKYTGRIRKKDLLTDTPWNTYTRPGLPPTPISSISTAALRAALHPENHKFMYFVSRGDGTSEFSRTLAEHNRAVAKYILGRG